jgi:hypothetical protein
MYSAISNLYTVALTDMSTFMFTLFLSILGIVLPVYFGIKLARKAIYWVTMIILQIQGFDLPSDPELRDYTVDSVKNGIVRFK